LCGQFTPKGIWVYVVDEGAPPLDLHHRDPLPVSRLQRGIAVDLDLLELERDLPPDLGDNLSRALAEMAGLRVVEDDATDKCRE
jgi:hypothetical protein